MDDDSNQQDASSKMVIAFLLILLIGSPGSLLIFAMPLESFPILLLIIIPITVLFIVWYRRILIRREAYRQGGFY